MSIRVAVWHEFRHEKSDPKVAAIYSKGIHDALASSPWRSRGLKVATATLDEPEHGLSVKRVAETNVLVWWGHMAHDEVAGVGLRLQWGRSRETAESPDHRRVPVTDRIASMGPQS